VVVIRKMIEEIRDIFDSEVGLLQWAKPALPRITVDSRLFDPQLDNLPRSGGWELFT
jgi:hypothetical protein